MGGSPWVSVGPGGAALTRRGLLLGSAAAAVSLALAGCAGKAGRPWEEEPSDTSGLWGYVDASGEWALGPRWERAGGFQDAGALVAWGGEAEGARQSLWATVVGASGAMGFEPVHISDIGSRASSAASFSCGLVPVTDASGSRTYMDRSGGFPVSLGDGYARGLWDARAFNEPDCFLGSPYAPAWYGGDAWGLLGTDGSWLIEPSTAFQDAPSSGVGAGTGVALLPMRSFGGWGYVAPDGSWAIRPALGSAQGFLGPIAPACDSDGLWGALSADGSWAIAAAHSALSAFDPSGSRALARDGPSGLWGVADGSGWACGPSWSDARALGDSLLAAEDPPTGLWGLASPDDGSWLVGPSWPGVGDVAGGSLSGCVLARDASSGLWGAADCSSGEWALPPTLAAQPYYVGADRLAVASADGPDEPLGLADALTGEWVAGPRFASVSSFADNGLACARNGG